MTQNEGGTRRTNLDTKKLVYLAILTALVVVLQFVSNISAGFLPVPLTLTLVPIVIGSALCGKWSGAWLGGVFAVVLILTGAAEPFFTFNPFGTIVTVLIKGVAAGIAAGLVYSLLEKKNKYLAICVAGFTAPIVNTGLFIAGSYIFFLDTIKEWAGGTDVFAYIILAMVGVNFLVELGLNIILAPTALRLINLKKND
ncbi:MAG: ECF transporter S component [Clostridia bacterium]|nr:ECF transporter S component [Clostridia bacterium]